MSTSVLAALLSALLLLSPGTARAVAHVLAENGITIPANVVRVLDALPSDAARDTLRRDDETVCVTANDATLKNEPEPSLVEWAVAIPSAMVLTPVTFADPSPTIRKARSTVPMLPVAYSPASPRAPPV